MHDMINKIALFFIFLSLNITLLNAQGSYSSPVQNFSMEGKTTLNLGNMMGRPFMVNNYDNIKGHPYFLDSSFKPAFIILSSGKGYTIDKLRLNLLTHQLHFLTPDNIEMVTGDGIIKKVVFYKKVKDTVEPVIFSNGYPAVDKYTELNYYEELNQGAVKALKICEKAIAKDINITASPLDKHFEEHINYYLFNSVQNKMVRWKKGEEFFMSFIADKTELLTRFSSDNKLNFRSISDVARILDYYNSLQTKQ